MPEHKLTNFILHRELKLQNSYSPAPWITIYHCVKVSQGEVCPRCASFCNTTYDRRQVKLKDTPIRGTSVELWVQKRRLWCKRCKKPFTEPVAGVMPRRRTTQRFRRSVLCASETFCDLKKVRKFYRCSNDFIYNAVYEQLELRRKAHNNYPWPRRIGLDEHNFLSTKHGTRQFVSMIVDHDNKKLRDVVLGKSRQDLWQVLENIPGRENVKLCSIDLA